MRYVGVLVAMLILVVACQPVEKHPLMDRIAEHPGEVLYVDIIGQEIPADQIKVFGIGLGDTEDMVYDLHGEPDTDAEYVFGRYTNLEYTLGISNNTVVLYHLELGVVKGILLTEDANSVLHGDTKTGSNVARVYSVLGIPTVSQDLHLQRVFFYDELGYEVFLRRNNVDRFFFTTPNRGITPVGVDKEDTCEGGKVFAQNQETQDCYEFPNKCIVPEGWDIVSACPVEQEAEDMPIEQDVIEVCIQVITPATMDGQCVEYPTPCDVPEGWTIVEAC